MAYHAAMARFAPLLRALLCLLLLVNGSASAHMAASTALEGAPVAAMLGDAMPAPPCHEDMDIGDMAGMQDTGDHQGFSRHTCKNDSQNLIYFCKS